MSNKKDKVQIGDIYPVEITAHSPQYCYVKVVSSDDSDFEFDLEDKSGDRCWNFYIVTNRHKKAGNIKDNPELMDIKKQVNLL